MVLGVGAAGILLLAQYVLILAALPRRRADANGPR